MFLSKNLDVDVRHQDGPASKELIRKTMLIGGGKGVAVGIKFDNVRIAQRKPGGGFEYRVDKSVPKVARDIDEYKELVERAKEEHVRSGVVYMAEGGYDNFELQEKGKYGGEYDSLDRETLHAEYEELGDQLGRTGPSDPSRNDSVERMEYIDIRREKMEEEAETSFTSGKYGEVPEPPGKYDGRTVKASITRDKREFLSKQLGKDINKGDGQASKELYDEMKIVMGKNERPSGIEFEGAKIVVSKDGGKTFDYSDNKKIRDKVDRFKTRLDNATPEHAETLEGLIDEEVRSDGLIPNEDVTEDIASNAIANIDESLHEKERGVLEQAGTYATEQEVRELAGILHPKGTTAVKIESLEIIAEQYRLKALNEQDPMKERFYKSVEEVAKLKAHNIRMEDGLRPEHEEAINMVRDEIENNDLSRLERFKKWAKKNMVGLSAIAITVASLITTIIVDARGAIKQGARATGEFAKAVANLAKKAGSLLAPLLNIVAQVISCGAKGLAWLASNL